MATRQAAHSEGLSSVTITGKMVEVGSGVARMLEKAGYAAGKVIEQSGRKYVNYTKKTGSLTKVQMRHNHMRKPGMSSTDTEEKDAHDIHYRSRLGIMKTALGIDLEPDIKEHIERCPECGKIAPLLQLKASSLKTGDFIERLVDKGTARDPSVLVREDGVLDYFYGRPSPDESGGYIVVWDRKRSIIRHFEYADAESFRRFKFKEPEYPIGRLAGGPDDKS